MTPELLDEWAESGCSVCGCVPVNNQGRCTKHKQPGDTVGSKIIVSPAQYKVLKESWEVRPSPSVKDK